MSSLFRFINTTRNAELADKGRIADNIWLRLKGLLGTSELREGEALLIRPCQSVHTLFMAYPIDVVFLDRHARVVRLYLSLRPFRLTSFVWRAVSAIELPAGTIERSSTDVGDTIILEARD